MSVEAEEIELRRAPRIKAEDVFAAADALLVDGHRPTIDRVRMKLGRGSPNTINEHLDTWWSHLGARLRDLPGQVLPGLPETVTKSLLQLWNLAVRESHAALLESLQAREAVLAAATADLERRAATLNQQEHGHLTRCAMLEDSLALAREQLGATNRRAESLEAALREREADLGRLRQRGSALEDDVKAMRAQLDTERAARQARDRARRRLFVMSHRLSELVTPAILVPFARAQARAQRRLTATALYGRLQDEVIASTVQRIEQQARTDGVTLKRIRDPRIHAKVLAWDSDSIVVSSQNWLSADPMEVTLAIVTGYSRWRMRACNGCGCSAWTPDEHLQYYKPCL